MKIKCPSCDECFEAEERMLQRIKGLYSTIKLIYRFFINPEPRLGIFYSSNIVICPYCYHSFRFKDYKYFGILHYLHIRFIIILCFFVFIIFIVSSEIIIPFTYIINSIKFDL